MQALRLSFTYLPYLYIFYFRKDRILLAMPKSLLQTFVSGNMMRMSWMIQVPITMILRFF